MIVLGRTGRHGRRQGRFGRRIAGAFVLLVMLAVAAVGAWQQGWIAGGPDNEEVRSQQAALVGGLAERLDVPEVQARRALLDYFRSSLQRYVEDGTLTRSQADALTRSSIDGDMKRARAIVLEMGASSFLSGRMPSMPSKHEMQQQTSRFVDQAARQLKRSRVQVIEAVRSTLEEDMQTNQRGMSMMLRSLPDR